MRKKQSKKTFIVSLCAFPFDVYFSFGETDAEVLKFLRKVKVGDLELKDYTYADFTSPAFCSIFENNAAMIRMRTIPTTPGDFGFLQHEITHYVYFLLGRIIKTPHNDETTEVYAYLTQYITEQAYLNIFKK